MGEKQLLITSEEEMSLNVPKAPVSLGWASVFLRNEARDIPLHSRVLCSAHSELKQTNKKKNTKAITNLKKVPAQSPE